MRELGLSLVELLVAIAIGAFIALAGTTYFATTFGAGISIQEATRAQAQFTALTNAVRVELRRAGYRGNPSQLANYLVTITLCAQIIFYNLEQKIKNNVGCQN